MGHIHLGVLPGTKKWREVADLLTDGAPDRSVIAASARAAENDLRRAALNPAFIECVRLLSLLPLAARDKDFSTALNNAGLNVTSRPELFDIIAALGERLEAVKETERDDFSELSRRALLSSITTHVGDRLPGLLVSTPEDVKLAFRQISAPREFSVYARGFFTRLIGETLRYWLDRELAAHVGREHRFRDAGDRSAFDQAIMQFSSEATFIIREFSVGWFAKNLREGRQITEGAAAAYGSIALKKMLEELALKWEP